MLIYKDKDGALLACEAYWLLPLQQNSHYSRNRWWTYKIYHQLYILNEKGCDVVDFDQLHEVQDKHGGALKLYSYLP